MKHLGLALLAVLWLAVPAPAVTMQDVQFLPKGSTYEEVGAKFRSTKHHPGEDMALL